MTGQLTGLMSVGVTVKISSNVFFLKHNSKLHKFHTDRFDLPNVLKLLIFEAI